MVVFMLFHCKCIIFLKKKRIKIYSFSSDLKKIILQRLVDYNYFMINAYFFPFHFQQINAIFKGI